MIVLDDVVSTYTTRIDSNRSSYARAARCAIADAYPDQEVRLLADGEWPNDVDRWIVVHPMEFTGKGFNLPSGPQEGLLSRLMRLVDTPPDRIFSLDRPLPDYNALLLKPRFKLDEEVLEQRVKEVTQVNLDSFVLKKSPVTYVVGDSHATAHYTRGACVHHHDHLTLHGVLNRGLETVVPSWALDTTYCEKLKFVFGNIDVRHHLCRLEDPITELHVLLERFESQIDALLALSDKPPAVEIVVPLPIEFEGRRLPKTGWYKNAPFYGTREERLDLVRRWWTWGATQSKYAQWTWPVSWYQMDGEQFAKTRMEKPNSVHLSPKWHCWDYEANEPNARLLEEG